METVKKLKGVGLALAMIFSIVLLSVYLAADLKSQLSNKTLNQLLIKDRLLKNIETIQDMILDTTTHFPDCKRYLALTDAGDSVVVDHRYWGAFEYFEIEAFKRNCSITKVLLRGDTVSPSLNISEAGNLNLFGKCKVQGNIFLNGSLKPGSLGNLPFSGSYSEIRLLSHHAAENNDSLTIDQIKNVLANLPDVHEGIITRRRKLNHSVGSLARSSTRQDSICRSFSEPTLILSYTKPLKLENVFYEGNILLFSNEKINISRESHLEDVILKAPEITIENGFSGVIQCFAERSIEIGSNCRLNFPSVLMVNNDRGSGEIIQRQLSSVAGVIVMSSISLKSGKLNFNDRTLPGKKENLYRVMPGATVRGEVIVNGRIALEGKIAGNVKVDRFCAIMGTEIHDNSMLNGTLICENGSVLSFLPRTSKKALLKVLS